MRLQKVKCMYCLIMIMIGVCGCSAQLWSPWTVYGGALLGDSEAEKRFMPQRSTRSYKRRDLQFLDDAERPPLRSGELQGYLEDPC